MDLSLLSALPEIHYEEGDLQALASAPLYFNCGVQLLCTCGEGLISTGAQQFRLYKMSELIFWGGSIMQLMEASDDFRVRMLLYPKKVFLQAAIALDTTYFNYMEESPLYNHGEKSWKNINLWIDLGEMLFTHFGISGPLVLSASAYLGGNTENVTAAIDLKPALDLQTLLTRAQSDFEKYKNRNLDNALSDLMPLRLIPEFISSGSLLRSDFWIVPSYKGLT